jgi:sugar fermentation stimulation protein A
MVGSQMATKPYRRPARKLESTRVTLAADLRGRLLRRYKRFLADIELDSGEIVTVHCPNPGSMRGTSKTGSAVRCSTSENPKRKLKHTLEMIRVGRIWVGLHTLRANQVAAEALEAGTIPSLRGYPIVQREISTGQSRLDFCLEGHPEDPRRAWVEVKSVTMAEGSTALFPDSVSERAKRHLETLATRVKAGDRAILLYVVQRADCLRVKAADEIDPEYAKALREAARVGVEIRAVRARVRATEIRLERTLPVMV